jgi:hypothetical protein
MQIQHSKTCFTPTHSSFHHEKWAENLLHPFSTRISIEMSQLNKKIWTSKETSNLTAAERKKIDTEL